MSSTNERVGIVGSLSSTNERVGIVGSLSPKLVLSIADLERIAELCPVWNPVPTDFESAELIIRLHFRFPLKIS